MAIPEQKIKPQSTSAMLTLSPSGTLRLSCSYMEREVAKSVPGWRWDSAAKQWDYPLNCSTIEALKMAFPKLVIPQNVDEIYRELKEQAEFVSQAKADGWVNAEPMKPMPIRTKPFKHQILAYNIGIKIPYVALLMEQGTGKSLTAVAITGRRFLNGEVRKVLVIAPASVVPVWPREFQIHADFPANCIPLDGPIAKRIQIIEKFTECLELTVLVTNYESVWRMEEKLKQYRPDLIICDESQRIKTPGTRQSKALHRLGKIAKYRMILTGTPVTQSPLDFYSQYKFLDPSIFGNSYYAFQSRYAIVSKFQNYSKVIGFQNMPELVEKVHSIAFRCTKKECLDLPEQIDQNLICKLEPAAERVYKQIMKESVAELESGSTLTAANILAKLLRLSQLAGGFLGDEEKNVHQVSTAKLDLLSETLDDLIGSGKKVVIFARFIPEVEAIKKLLCKKKIDFRSITGSISLPVRGIAVEQFQTKDHIKVFLAQIQCAGLGITLTAADTAIFYSYDFSFANYDQARSRIHRIGQRNTCTYIHLVAKDTVDEKILAALQSKRDVATQVVDNWKQYFTKEENPK